MRTNNTDWNEYFFALAMVCASRSKDPNTTNGSVIVNDKNVIVGMGYNGFLRGLDDVEEHWNNRPEKYRRVFHAERNAIANANGSVEGCRMYVWSSRDYFCCEECASEIIQNGIKEVHFIRVAGSDDNNWGFNSAKGLFEECKVSICMHPEIDETVILDKVGSQKGSSLIADLTAMRDRWVEQLIVNRLVPLMIFSASNWGLSVTIPREVLETELNSSEYKAVEEYISRNRKNCIDFFR